MGENVVPLFWRALFFLLIARRYRRSFWFLFLPFWWSFPFGVPSHCLVVNPYNQWITPRRNCTVVSFISDPSNSKIDKSRFSSSIYPSFGLAFIYSGQCFHVLRTASIKLRVQYTMSINWYRTNEPANNRSFCGQQDAVHKHNHAQ